MRLLFVHRLIAMERADVVIPTSPLGLQECLDAQLPTSTIDDFIARPLVAEDDYLRWQISFFERLPAFDNSGWESRHLAANVLKTAVDSFVSWARMLGGVLDELRPQEVCVQWARSCPFEPLIHRNHLAFRPSLGDVPLVVDCLGTLCRDRDIRFSALAADDARGVATMSASRRLRSLVLESIQMAYTLLHPSWRRGGRGALFTSLGSGLRLVARDTARGGGRLGFVTYKRGRLRYIRGGTMPRVLLDCFVRPLKTPRGDIDLLLDELRPWAGMTPDRILRSRVQHYLYDICGRIEAAGQLLEPILLRERIQRLYCSHPHWIGDFAGLLAAGRSGVTRTLVQHGDQLMSLRYFLAAETVGFDEMIVSDASIPAHLRASATLLKTRSPTFLGNSPRVTVFSRRHRAQHRRWEQLPICYVPTMFVGDSQIIDGGYFEDAEYYRWQLRLLTIFAAYPGLQFVWKSLPTSNEAEDPIPERLEQLKLRNVEYRTEPFQALLDSVGRVLTDFPSTVAYEAAHAGHPLLALGHSRYIRPRPEAFNAFGVSAAVVDDWKAAAAAIERFIHAPPEHYIVPSGSLPT